MVSRMLAIARPASFWALLTLLVAGMLVPSSAFSQGESAVPFLLIAPNARADGMGEAGAAMADDASAIFWNPAGLAFQTGQEISLTHSAWLPQFQLPDLFYDYLSYRNHVDDWGGTFGASLTYLSLGEFQETDVDPTPISTFRAFELGATVGYATKIADDLGIGMNLRFIHSSLANFEVQQQKRKGVASSVSFDIATMWRPQAFNDMFSVGLNLSNLGPKLTYIDAAQADPLPTNLRLGIGAQIVKSEYNNINFVIDFNRLLVRRYKTDSTLNSSGQMVPLNAREPDDLPKSLFSAWGDGGLKKVTVGTGVEYWYGAPKLVALRFGYFYEHPDYGNRKFLTFGAGIRYDMYGFDFSYLSAIEENHPLSETLRFTLLIAWGGQAE